MLFKILPKVCRALTDCTSNLSRVICCLLSCRLKMSLRCCHCVVRLQCELLEYLTIGKTMHGCVLKDVCKNATSCTAHACQSKLRMQGTRVYQK